MTAKKQLSVFEQARNAKRRVEHYDIPLVESDEAEDAARALSAAKTQARAEHTYGSPAEKRDADKRVADAQAAYDACFRRVSFRGLPPRDFDALASQHVDPEDKESAPEGHVWFVYWLAAASAVEDYGVTAEQWQSLCEESWTLADGQTFRNAVMSASARPYSDGISKD